MEPRRENRPRNNRRWIRWAVWWPRFSKVILAIVGIAGAGLLLAMLAGVFQEKVSSVASDGAARAIPVGAVTVPARVIRQPRFESAVGTIKPVHEAVIAAKILARVTEVNVVSGQSVEAGAVLVRLDDQDLQSRLKQAMAAADAAEAMLTQAEADFGRASGLLQSNAIARADFDHADAKLKTARADRQRAGEALTEASILSDYAIIKAPFAATVIEKKVEVGDTVAPGQPLLTLYDPDKMQMVASVRESLALELRVGQQLPAQLESLGHDCLATVSEIVPRAETGSRSFDVKVTGPCPEGVYSGMFGRLLIPLEDESILIVPLAAVDRVGQLTLVEVAADGLLQRRNVLLGRSLDHDVEVLSGLRAGEVVLSPIDQAKESRE